MVHSGELVYVREVVLDVGQHLMPSTLGISIKDLVDTLCLSTWTLFIDHGLLTRTRLPVHAVGLLHAGSTIPKTSIVPSTEV